MATNVKWDEIKTEYITSDISSTALAKKHNVSYSSLAKKMAKEDWKEERKKYGRKVEEKAVNKTAEQSATRIAAALAQENDIVDSFLKMLKDSVDSDSYTTSEGKLNVQKVKDAAYAMSKLIELKRLITGVQTVGEEQAYKIASERLNLERKKIENGISAEKDIKVDFPEEMKEWLV